MKDKGERTLMRTEATETFKELRVAIVHYWLAGKQRRVTAQEALERSGVRRGGEI